MELDILQSVDKEIWEANALLQTLKYFENEHVMKLVQILIEKQKTEMLEVIFQPSLCFSYSGNL